MSSFSWTHQSAEGQNRLDAALAANIEALSRAAAQRIIREGAVSVDGQTVTRPSFSLSDGQVVEARLPAPTTQGITPVDAEVAVVFGDEHVVVIDKPAGIAVHPGSGHIDDTLVNYMVARYPAMAAVGEPDRPGVVHRLDRDTSGLLVFALTGAAYRALVAALKSRSVSRTYTALVFGHPSPDAGVIDAPVGRDPANRTRQAVVSNGKAARTRYRVIRRIGPWCLLEVHLETGRMHQVRVHMAAAGYPVAGDPTYGRAPRIEGLGRQFLHASRLAFLHPVSGEPLEFESPLPDELQAVLDQLEPSA